MAICGLARRCRKAAHLDQPEMKEFTIDRQIGSGNFAKVCLGILDGTKVAIKVFGRGPQSTRMAENEARVLRRIRDRGVVNCTEMIEHVFGHRTHYIVMRLYTNATHTTLLDYILSDAISLARSKSVIVDVLKGMAGLKRAGVTHTDLKPENIMFDLAGRAVIVDFGSATLYERQRGLIQTRPYRSPESILDLWFDASTDVWSLGCIFYEMVTGTCLFAQAREHPGHISNEDEDHLWMIEQVCSHFPRDYVQASPFVNKFFGKDGSLFGSRKATTRTLHDLLCMANEGERKQIQGFIERMLQILPCRRATPTQLLDDPFLHGDSEHTSL